MSELRSLDAPIFAYVVSSETRASLDKLRQRSATGKPNPQKAIQTQDDLYSGILKVKREHARTRLRVIHCAVRLGDSIGNSIGFALVCISLMTFPNLRIPSSIMAGFAYEKLRRMVFAAEPSA